MKRVKRRIFSGTVCEQEVYMVGANTQNIKTAAPRPRFATEEEREKHKQEISRRKHARMFNATFSPASLYSTLTFDNRNEVHTFAEAKQLRDNYVRRLQHKYPGAQLVIYIGRGLRTKRIHMHMVSNGIPREEIISKWGMGEIVRIDPLREHNYYNGIDHGRDYSGLANYLFDHWTPDQGGHRYKATRSVCRPEPEETKETRRVYTENKPPQAPKGYKLVEAVINKFGYGYFKYVYIDETQKHRKKC